MDGSINAHVSERLRQRREELGHTKTALAKAMGINLRQLSKIERGEARLGASLLYRAAIFLGASIDTFFEGAPENAGRATLTVVPPPTSQTIAPEEIAQLQRNFLAIPESKIRENLLKMIKAAAQSKI